MQRNFSNLVDGNTNEVWLAVQGKWAGRNFDFLIPRRELVSHCTQLWQKKYSGYSRFRFKPKLLHVGVPFLRSILVVGGDGKIRTFFDGSFSGLGVFGVSL
jgi:hypothetical protein